MLRGSMSISVPGVMPSWRAANSSGRREERRDGCFPVAHAAATAAFANDLHGPENVPEMLLRCTACNAGLQNCTSPCVPASVVHAAKEERKMSRRHETPGALMLIQSSFSFCLLQNTDDEARLRSVAVGVKFNARPVLHLPSVARLVYRRKSTG